MSPFGQSRWILSKSDFINNHSDGHVLLPNAIRCETSTIDINFFIIIIHVFFFYGPILKLYIVCRSLVSSSSSLT